MAASKRLRMKLLNPFVVVKDGIQLASCLRSPALNERLRSPQGTSSFSTQCTSCLVATATIVKTEKMIKGVCKPTKTKRTKSTADAAVCRGFGDKLD